MTTKEAAALYLAQHVQKCADKNYAVYNPNNLPVESLPVIYGFNNGGSDGWYSAQLIAEDGTALGSHICSNEGYMEIDLGILEGTRPNRHKSFKSHYPDGYRMEFVPSYEIDGHEGLQKAFILNNPKEKDAG